MTFAPGAGDAQGNYLQVVAACDPLVDSSEPHSIYPYFGFYEIVCFRFYEIACASQADDAVCTSLPARAGR